MFTFKNWVKYKKLCSIGRVKVVQKKSSDVCAQELVLCQNRLESLECIDTMLDNDIEVFIHDKVSNMSTVHEGTYRRAKVKVRHDEGRLRNKQQNFASKGCRDRDMDRNGVKKHGCIDNVQACRQKYPGSKAWCNTGRQVKMKIHNTCGKIIKVKMWIFPLEAAHGANLWILINVKQGDKYLTIHKFQMCMV